MCSPALMRQVHMPAHVTPPHVHGAVVAERAHPEPPEEHEEHGPEEGGAELVAAAPGRRVGRRALFRMSAIGGAGIAATTALGGVASAATATGRGAGPSGRSPRVVDLTHELGEDFPVVYKLVEQPEIEQIKFLDVDGFNANQLTVNEHSGTHIDVPGHFSPGAPTLEQLSAELLVVPLVVIRIADRASRDHDARLTVNDIRKWESRYGRLPARSFVAVDSGWWRRVDTPGAFLNEDSSGVFHFPGISPEAAAFLVQERNVVGAGTDTSSLDGGAAAVPLTHQTLLPAGKYGIENLAALDSAPDNGATLIVGAPKHRGGFGGQIRALALV
ncbi:cyclase family protein [Streptomyces millisiae]|uniref:Cyclase family protein n=1 Tax=Streptomyces millisiae TaxID=3075542 RepID=A0ABU2LQR1_9ACTN|nr:cyclase family protein [Streptomyces sp. DSM 44918]MDT0319919.1 cyclase family protein [Streptomyces sp. DSM 44918]